MGVEMSESNSAVADDNKVGVNTKIAYSAKLANEVSVKDVDSTLICTTSTIVEANR